VYLQADGETPTTPGPCDDGSTPTTDGVICKLLLQDGERVSANSTVAKGSVVLYETYKQKTVGVPYVISQSYGDAESLLRSAGLKIKRGKDVDTFEQDKGNVVSQTPDNNTTVSPGSTVTVRLSTGKAKLPDVRNKKLNDALQQLNGLGFTNTPHDKTVVTHDKSKDGLVAEESPTPGIAYAANQEIQLTVYRYKPLPPTCDPDKTPTPSGGASSPVLPSGSISLAPTPSVTPTNTLPPCGQ
jgi:serine/threonine-protein kinase